MFRPRGGSTVRMRPARLNAAIASLFLAGSSGFVVGSIPAYAGAVGDDATALMVGSILFMVAALAGYVLPGSGEVPAIRVDLAGTLLGALCFLIGAALLFPAWRSHARPPAGLTRPG